MEDDARVDRRLVRAIASGDRGALGELYDRHAPLLLSVGMRILRERAEAEDVLHDVFLEVWRKAHTYDPERASVRAWLLLRMRSRCLDRAKSAALSRRSPLDAAPQKTAADDPSRGADARHLGPWLDTLSEEQKRVIVLGYFEGLSCSEMASRLGIPIGTVKSRLGAAMRKLRAAVKMGARP